MTEPPCPTVVVAALTYKRPEMLAQLLESLLTLQRPADWDVRFLIVDNDPQASARATVEPFAERFEGSLDYVVEAEAGIPFGRNRALQESTTRGAELLAFIDDDEVPEPTWLAELIRHYERTGAVLIGGPCRLLPPMQPPDTRWRRFIARSLVARSDFLERRWNILARRGEPTYIGTGNWLANVEWLARKDVSFDTGLRYTGGSDTAFFNSVKRHGGQVSWCPVAIVYEHMQAERLSLRYNLGRSRSQAMVLCSLYPQSPWKMIPRQTLRAAIGCILMIVPVLGLASFMMGAHMVAAAWGRFSSLGGAQSRLYERVSFVGRDGLGS